jgi:hypothetical protein
MSTGSPFIFRSVKTFISKCKYAQMMSTVTTHLHSLASMRIDSISAWVATVNEDVSSFVYRFLCALPSATILPYILPHRFSFISLIACSTAFFLPSSLLRLHSKSAFFLTFGGLALGDRYFGVLALDDGHEQISHYVVAKIQLM